MIPPFNQKGWLPERTYDCTLEEAAARLGGFQNNDQRPRLWARFTEYIGEAKSCGFIEAVILDGSFVTAEPSPGDIDLVLVLAVNYDLAAELTPVQYNLLSQRRMRSRLGFDIVVVKNGSENLNQAIAFFQQVKQQPGARKGILRIRL